MDTTIQVSPEIYQLLQRRAHEMNSTPEVIAETVIRLQLGNSIHIEQKDTISGPQAYIRNSRVAVRHIAAFLQAGQAPDEIANHLSHLPPAAIYEAIAYYYDHQAEIDAELAANSQNAIQKQLQQMLNKSQYQQLTRQLG